MAYVQHKMTSLIVLDPAEATRQILAAFRQAGTSRRAAAKLLGVDEDTFANWGKKLALTKEFKRLENRALKEGWHHGNLGGAGDHKNPGLKTRRTKQTWKAKRKAATAP